jgi:probable HAF family extracellular repeat protein
LATLAVVDAASSREEHMVRLTVRFLLMLALIARVGVRAAAQDQWIAQDLGTLGGDSSIAYDVNDRGVVVGTSKSSDGQSYPFVWTLAAGMRALEGTNAISATAINRRGWIAGKRFVAGTSSCAFVWSGVQKDVMCALSHVDPVSINRGGTVSGDYTESFELWRQPFVASQSGVTKIASADSSDLYGGRINDHGTMAGWDGPIGRPELAGAFLWTAAAGRMPLSVPTNARPYGVNNGGQIAGAAGSIPPTFSRAFSWTAAGGYVELPTLGGRYSFAADVNDRGVIVGDSQILDSDNAPYRGYVLRPGDTTPRFLDGRGDDPASPARVNRHGTIVGTTRVSALGGAARATIWRRSETLVVDRDSAGLWRLADGPSWTQLHTRGSEDTVRADLDGNDRDDLVVDFGHGDGVWVWMNDAEWIQLHHLSPSAMAVGDLDHNGSDEVIVSFDAAGVWLWRNHTTWQQLHGSAAAQLAAANLDGEAGDDVVMDFPGFGLYVWTNDDDWTWLHPASPTRLLMADIGGDGSDDLITEFAGAGIWSYQATRANWEAPLVAAWQQLHPWNAVHIGAGDVGGSGTADLIVDFGTGPGPSGLWMLRGSSWLPLHTASVGGVGLADLDADGRDDLLADFGSLYGTWKFVENGGWTFFDAASPRRFEARKVF